MLSEQSTHLEYINGKENVSADMLFHLPHRLSDSHDDNELTGPDKTYKTFEVSMVNSSNINPKIFVQYNHQITESQCTNEELHLPDYDLVAEQMYDKELLKLK